MQRSRMCVIGWDCERVCVPGLTIHTIQLTNCLHCPLCCQCRLKCSADIDTVADTLVAA
jgi:hypothetical protein